MFRWPLLFLWPAWPVASHIEKQPLRKTLREPQEETTVRLVFSGDVMVKNKDRVPDIHWRLREKIARADLFIGPLEAPLGEVACNASANYVGGWRLPLFEMPFDFLQRLFAQAGLKADRVALSVATNHIADQGLAGFETTRNLLARAGYHVVGLFDPGRPPISVIEVKGLRLGFVAWTQWMNKDPFSHENPGVMRDFHVDQFDWRTITAQQHIDSLIALPHWDFEMCTTPSPGNREIARRLLTTGGFDVLCGSHPHIIQPVELFGSNFCQYSLSNFTFTLREMCGIARSWMMNASTLTEVTLDGVNGRVVGYEVHPFVEVSSESKSELVLIEDYAGQDRDRYEMLLSGIFDTGSSAGAARR